MGALSFKGQFVPKIEAGLKRKPGGKRQSIRNFRKRPLWPGERLVLYFAQRSKWCKKLGETKIDKVYVISIDEHIIKVYMFQNPDQFQWRWDLMSKEVVTKSLKKLELYYTLSEPEILNVFSQHDGFKDWETMKRWWKLTHGPECFPYFGNLYKW